MIAQLLDFSMSLLSLLPSLLLEKNSLQLFILIFYRLETMQICVCRYSTRFSSHSSIIFVNTYEEIYLFIVIILFNLHSLKAVGVTSVLSIAIKPCCDYFYCRYKENLIFRAIKHCYL